MPLRLALTNAEIDGLSVRQNVQRQKDQSQIDREQNDQILKLNKIKLNATSLFSKVDIKQLTISADAFNIEIKGKLQPTNDYHHDLAINWQFTLPSKEIAKGEGQLTGNTKSTHITQNLSGPLQLTLDATLKDLLEQLRWTAKVDVSDFDITKIDPTWPALSGAAKLNTEGDLSTATVTGKLQGHYPELGAVNADFNLQRMLNNTIQINQLTLHAPKQNTQINADGFWSPADTVDTTTNNDGGHNGGNFKLSLNWQNLFWPPEETQWFNSAKGSGTIEGNLNRYQITLDTDSPWPQTNPSTWHANAVGNQDGMTIQTLRVNALNGEAIASGQLNWSPKLNWQAEARINNIDPAALLPEWPGKLSGNVTSSGHMEKDQLIIQADISQLEGKLRDYPVSLDSRIAWQNDQLTVSQLNFLSGKSKVTIKGQLGETLNLNWSVDSNDLAELYPQAKGDLQAKGTLKGSRSAPFIATTFDAKSVSYLNYSATNIKGEAAIDLEKWQQIDIQLSALSLKKDDAILESLNINTQNQTTKVHAVSKNVTALLEFKGETDSTGWRGQITQADIQSKDFDNWQLKIPATLNLSKQSVEADNLCWQNEQQASLCATLDYKKSLLRSQIIMNDLPLKLFSKWLPPDLKLESTANGTAELEQLSAEQLLANVHIKLPAGILSYPMLNGEKDQREYKSGNLKIVLDNKGLDATSEFIMDNGDQLLAQLTLPGIKPLTVIPPEQPIKASAQLRAKDLRLIETIITDVSDLKGELTANLTASGTLAHPIISGQSNIDNGSFQLPKLGLNIKQLKLNGQSHSDGSGNNNFDFQLDARSGDGNIIIKGQTKLDRNAGWPTNITIQGEDFTISDTPEARATMSPDLNITLKSRAINIKGKVHIPYAKLQPKDLSQAEKVSSDTIIIGGDQPAEEKWLINTDIRLTLGERVHFYGFGFEGRLGGNVLLQDEPGQLTRATGEITVPEGVYRAYGQRLVVENGKILYTGGPLTNPGLNFRAVRKVNDVTAGILVKGSLSQPQLEIFSTPSMGQTDALAYIVLGGPIEKASNEEGAVMAKAALALGLSGGDHIARALGDRFKLDDLRIESSDKGDQAELVIGRYLSPKLYASYGVGLIERINTLTLRYQISNKWQVKVESGGYQGADILYTIER